MYLAKHQFTVVSRDGGRRRRKSASRVRDGVTRYEVGDALVDFVQKGQVGLDRADAGSPIIDAGSRVPSTPTVGRVGLVRRRVSRSRYPHEK